MNEIYCTLIIEVKTLLSANMFLNDKNIWRVLLCLIYCFIVYRGLPASVRKGPFRKWYGHLGELRSLIPKECNIMVLTATATKRTKQQILETLLFSADDITFR